MFGDFEIGWCDTDGGGVPYRVAGTGPALLLLHGFPQTGALWAHVAPRLAARFTVIVPDLRGYGRAAAPEPSPDLANYGFRAMAADQVALLDHLGHASAHVAGHDRGGRVAHRLALDAPSRVDSLCVMDIVPTIHLLRNLTPEVARDYYHWFFLAQPAPFAETMIAGDPDRFFESCLLGWGGARIDSFDPGQLDDYRAAWRDPDRIAGMCADYRATLSVDLACDTLDQERQVACPALVLYGADGVMARHYDVAATWAPCLVDMRAKAIPGGHFFVDQVPDAVAGALESFLP